MILMIKCDDDDDVDDDMRGAVKHLRVIHKMNGGCCTADIGDALVKAALGRVPQSAAC